MPATLEYSERPSDSVKRYIRAGQAGVIAAGELWAREFMPRHFTPEGEQLYSYAKRQGEGEPAWIYSTTGKGLATKNFRRIVKNPGYWWKKKRQGWGTISLVKTGESARTAIQGVRVRKETVDDATVRAVVRVPVPQYFFMWRERNLGGHIDKVKELSTIIPAEATAMEAAVRATIDQMMQRAEAASRRTVRAA